MMQKARSLITGLAKAGFSIALLAWLIQSGKLDIKLLGALLNLKSVFIGFILIGGSLAFVSERWRSLCLSQNLSISRFDALKLSLIGIFFNFAVPGGVGGDLIKGWYFANLNPEKKSLAATTVLMDRVLGLYAMIIMALTAMCVDLDHVFSISTLTHLFYMIVILFFGTTLGFFALFAGFLNKLPVGKRIKGLISDACLIGKNKKTLLITFFLSLVAQSLSICFLWYAGSQMVALSIPLHTYFLVAPLGFMATAIPISPGGIGVGQAAFFYLFNLYLGSESPVGSATLTALQGAQLAFGIVGAYFYLTIKGTKKP